MVASRGKPRGQLVRDDGRPHTPESLARVTRLDDAVIAAAIERLLQIGFLEIVSRKSSSKKGLRSHPAARTAQDSASAQHASAAEQEGKEHHQQEQNRKKRTECSPVDSAASDLSEGDAPRSKTQLVDDDEPGAGVAYASPEDELKAIFKAKAGHNIGVEVLDAIRANILASGIDMGDFVAEVKKHVKNPWRNPPGFLRDLSRKYRAKILETTAPVTAAEAAQRSYRCSICGSRVQGAGARLEKEQFVPCVCASPEYVARQRARGVFA
jgi:DNA-directed RNA polymerase subunit RPC12/RpoP